MGEELWEDHRRQRICRAERNGHGPTP